jgi:hypothetical protein
VIYRDPLPSLNHIGGSRRRGRLASIRYFAAMLAGREVEVYP